MAETYWFRWSREIFRRDDLLIRAFFCYLGNLSLHRFYFQFESCFFSFRQKSQFFRDD
ncbi:hypothetical protein LEP1GSC166_2622 [Leptospira kirschneri]|nr:hypothetical protein LEP1GSC166_2622 [Leptospira kirschneri]